MSSPFNEQLEQVMAQFTEQRAKLEETQRDLQKVTVSVTPKDHLLTVTMGIAGELKDIKFHRNDYATMAPAELSAILVDTINKAREKAASKAQTAFSELAGFSAGLRDSLAGGPELDDIFALIDGATTAPPKRVDRDKEDFDG